MLPLNKQLNRAIELHSSPVEGMSNVDNNFRMNKNVCFQTELFQDDLFPPTRVTWTETISAEEWFANKDKKPIRLNLQPEGMDCLSAAAPPQPTITRNESHEINYGSSQLSPEHVKSKQEEIKKSVSERVQLNYELEQDTMEGVDSTEWEE